MNWRDFWFEATTWFGLWGAVNLMLSPFLLIGTIGFTMTADRLRWYWRAIGGTMYALVWLSIMLALCSCGRQAPPAEPEFLAINPPNAVTECDAQPCFCDSITQFSGYQRSQYTLMPGDYMGDGPLPGTVIVFTDTLIYHIVPDGPCGRAQAANAACELCVDGRTQETELLAHTYSGATVPGTLTFRGRDGKAYILYWHKPVGVVHQVAIPAAADTVEASVPRETIGVGS